MHKQSHPFKTPQKLNILFMQSQDYYGADSAIHGLIMRYLDREQFTIHAACNPGKPGEPSAALRALREIPNLHVRETHFGPTVTAQAKAIVAKNAITGTVPMLSSLGGLVNYMRRNNIHIIHCTEKPRDAFYGYWLARLGGAKHVVHLHVKAETWISPMVRWVMHHSDGLIAISDFVADSLVDMGYSRSKIQIVLNSLDLSLGWNQPVCADAVRQEFGIPPDQSVLAIISRLFYWKGHVELLNALAKVKVEMPNFTLLLVGEDDPRATPGRSPFSIELKDLVSALGLENNVIFTGFRNDIPQIMAACDIFAMPSFEEPFGMVYLEAMSMQRPIIALDNGGAREVVEHGKSGLLSAPGDTDQMAANILTLIRNPNLRKTMGQHGREQVETFFNPQRMAQEMGRAYRRIVQKS